MQRVDGYLAFCIAHLKVNMGAAAAAGVARVGNQVALFYREKGRIGVQVKLRLAVFVLVHTHILLNLGRKGCAMGVHGNIARRVLYINNLAVAAHVNGNAPNIAIGGGVYIFVDDLLRAQIAPGMKVVGPYFAIAA